MSFAKEDKAAWLSSEIMQEFEKIAREQGVLDGPPPEAFLPIGKEAQPEEEEDPGWEDESQGDFEDALEEFESDANDLQSEFHLAYNENLFSNLEKLAHQLAEKSNIKAAYRVEQTLFKLKDILKEEK